MNKKVNFISSKFFALLMVFVMLFSYIMPLVPVNAELRVHGEGDDRLNIDINNESGFSIQSVTVNGDTWTDGEDEYHTTDGIYQIVISLNKKGDDIPDIGWGGNWNGYITSTSTNEGDLYTYTLTLKFRRKYILCGIFMFFNINNFLYMFYSIYITRSIQHFIYRI